jgi:hypothetical protein
LHINTRLLNQPVTRFAAHASLEVFAGEQKEGNEAEEFATPSQWTQCTKGSSAFFSLWFASQTHEAVHLNRE